MIVALKGSSTNTCKTLDGLRDSALRAKQLRSAKRRVHQQHDHDDEALAIEPASNWTSTLKSAFHVRGVTDTLHVRVGSRLGGCMQGANCK